MYYIVLLGNPGEEYSNTRHNVAQYLADKNFFNSLRLGSVETDHYLRARTAIGRIGNQIITVVWPDTFMNQSGEVVAKCISPDKSEMLIVVHDDMDLPFGEVRVAFGRGDAGHNGIKSIIKSMQTKNFVRIRVGIRRTSFLTGKMLPRPSGEALNKYVLGNLSLRDKAALKSLSLKIPDILSTIVLESYPVAMNKYN